MCIARLKTLNSMFFFLFCFFVFFFFFFGGGGGGGGSANTFLRSFKKLNAKLE